MNYFSWYCHKLFNTFTLNITKFNYFFNINIYKVNIQTHLKILCKYLHFQLLKIEMSVLKCNSNRYLLTEDRKITSKLFKNNL